MSVFKKDRIYEELRADILSGKYAPGFKFPPETAFAVELGIGKITLRNALARLEQELLVNRIRGNGTFVRHQGDDSPTRSVIMVYRDRSNNFPGYFTMNLMAEFRLQAKEAGISELFITLNELTQLTLEELNAIADDSNALGFFLFPHVYTGQEPWLKMLKDTGYPIVLTNALDQDCDNTGCAGVTMQMADGMKQAIRHLASCSYRRLAIIANETPFPRILAMSNKEIITECKGNDMECDPEMIVMLPDDRATVENTVRELLSRHNRPDAFIVEMSQTTRYICEAISKCSLEVGKDIGVIAYTSQDKAFAAGNISSLDQDLAGLARKSYQLMLESAKWHNKTEVTPPNRYHFFRLRPRASTRPPVNA